MTRLSFVLLVAVLAACSKKAESPPTPTPTTAEPAPAPAPTPPAAQANQVQVEAAIVYSEDSVRAACATVVTLRDAILTCEGGAKAVEGEMKSVDSLNAAMAKGIPAAEMRPRAIEACKRSEQRLRTIATDIKCTL